MDSAEQAALSESERDSARAQSQTSTFRHQYDHRHMNDYLSDDAKDMPPQPMRRFENLVVNLTHSSILTPAGVDVTGKTQFILFFLFSRPFRNQFIFFCGPHRARRSVIDRMVAAFGSDICQQFGT